MTSMCCPRKRSRNDSLRDSATGATYCGTCWHQFLQPHLPVPNPTEAPPSDEPTSLDATVEDVPSLHPLKSIEHEGSKFLISTSRRLVLSPTRIRNRYHCVGELTSDNKPKIFKVSTIAVTTSFPYEVAAEDHCETPQAAYDDLAPILKVLAKLLDKTPATLRIWDPYYCAGSVKTRLARHGFTNVHNECEDFYEVISTKRFPEHDVIVTNPPYSTSPIDHIQKLTAFLVSQDAPWFVVQPNYVYTKDFWTTLTSTRLKAPRPFFLTPTSPRRYKYKSPCGLRFVGNAQMMKTSPFVTLWYCWVGSELTQKVYEWLVGKDKKAQDVSLSLACTEYFLPDAFKDSSDRTRRKKRKKDRENGPGRKARKGWERG